MKLVPIGVLLLVLAWAPAHAEPSVRLDVVDGIARIQLVGDFARTYYTVFRGTEPDGPWTPITDVNVLCLGPCLADDPEAQPGTTYWYRFDFVNGDGSRASIGPLRVSIPARLERAVAVRVWPNPMRSAAEIEIHLALEQPSTRAEIRVFDASGRLVRHLGALELPRGLSRIRWDGRDRTDRPVGPGIYFVRTTTASGFGLARVIRTR